MKNRLIRRGIIVVALLVTLSGMPVGAAQTIDEAVAAYERGDYTAAIRGFRKATEQGNAASQVNLGHAYAEGRGAPQDYQEALKWYRKATGGGIQRLVSSRLPERPGNALRWDTRSARG